MNDDPPCVTIRPSVLYFGTPVALISTLEADGRTNLTVMSSAWALGDRLVLGLGVGGQALMNLARTPECVVNLPSPALWEQVDRLGPTTGRPDVPQDKRRLGFVHEPDKFARGGFTPRPSLTVRPARVAECPLQLEARVATLHTPTADVAGQFRMVEVQVTRVHAHQDIVVPGTNHIDTDRWSPLLYVFRHYFGGARDLGRNVRAER